MSVPNTLAIPCREDRDCLLVVEGKDDCNSIYHLASHHALETKFGIWDGGSDEGALSKFGGALLASSKKYRVVAVVLDCDGDEALASRWAQVCHRLKGFGYEIPQHPNVGGTIIEGSAALPRVGAWFMPNNLSGGMLEDFLLTMISAESAAYIRNIVKKAKLEKYASYKEVHEAKAVAHTYLAWQDEPGRPLGLGVKAKHFNPDAEDATRFINWLKRLFVEDVEAATSAARPE